MPLRRFLWRLFQYQCWRYLLLVLLTCQSAALLLAPGYVSRAVFNVLGGKAALPGGVYGLAMLLVALEIARVGSDVMASVTGATAGFTAKALVRVNLLHRILTHPGARALPDSSGDAVSRFRDDADLTEYILRLMIDALGQGLYAIVALITMLRIDAAITLLVVLPLAAILIVTQRASAPCRLSRRRPRGDRARNRRHRRDLRHGASGQGGQRRSGGDRSLRDTQ